jgi:hypothetical protein
MSTSLAALQAEVYKLTNRPDLINETEVAVKAATLKAHQSDFYSKDLFESGVIFDSAEYLQSLDYKALVPQYRALKYIRKSDVSGLEGAFLEVISTEQVLDGYGVTREDVVYLGGLYLQIRSSTELQYILFGCYENPVITASAFSSWIADEHPYAVIFDAVATVFKTIGFDEQAAIYKQMVAEQYAELKMELAVKGE